MNLKFNKETQDKLFVKFAEAALEGNVTAGEKRTALRNIWEGFGTVKNATLDNIVQEIESSISVTPVFESPYPVKRPYSKEEIFKSPYPVKRPTIDTTTQTAEATTDNDDALPDEGEFFDLRSVPIDTLLDPSIYLFGTNDREEKIKILKQMGIIQSV